MYPLKQRELTLLKSCDCKYDSKLLSKAILWKAKNPMISIKRVYLYGKYPAVTIDGKKTHIHRLIYEYKNQQEDMNDKFVHHKDGDKFNSYYKNLESMNVKKHQHMHNVGKIISEDQKQAIRNFNINTKTRADVIRWQVNELHDYGFTYKQIGNLFGCSESCAHSKRILHDKENKDD